MAAAATPGREAVLETGRLLLRPWRVAEAVVQRELWTERDPRVPPHRRIDAAKVGFTETERTEVDAVYGTTLFTTRRLWHTPDVWP